MTYSDFEAQTKLFAVEGLHDGIHVIRDAVGVQMYLIQGDKKAALLDTGIGIGNVCPVVDAITDKSVEVYLTHGHVDHAGGIYGFDKVRVSALDRELLQLQTTRDFRLDFAGAYFPQLLRVDGIKGRLTRAGMLSLRLICPPIYYGITMAMGGGGLSLFQNESPLP